MRHSFLAVALATALGTATPAAVAADHSAELAALKAQLAELTAKVAELEARTDAQSDINIGTQQNIENIAATTPKVETKGGIKVTSPDRKFEASLGGRIHFDAYSFNSDVAATTDTTEFRRARLTLSGKAYGWEYKVENDFSAGSNLDGFRDLYIARNMLGGKVTIMGRRPEPLNRTAQELGCFAIAGDAADGSTVEAALITGTNLVLDGGNTIVCGQMLRAKLAADPRR